MSDDSGHELVLPPISDDDNICLPLSVNAVAKYWNIDLPIAEANEIVSKYVGMNGSILIEGINLAERHGLSSLILHSSITELKQAIDMGIPPIVILPGLHDVVQHASVISGYDDNEKTIFEILKSNSGIQLSDLKIQSGLSNKGWDKGIKGLTSKELAKVYKTDDVLVVDFLG